MAALYGAQTLIEYRDTGQISGLYLGGVFVFIAVFVAFWFVERK